VLTTSTIDVAFKWPSASTAQLVVSMRPHSRPGAAGFLCTPVYLLQKARTNGSGPGSCSRRKPTTFASSGLAGSVESGSCTGTSELSGPSRSSFYWRRRSTSISPAGRSGQANSVGVSEVVVCLDYGVAESPFKKSSCVYRGKMTRRRRKDGRNQL
jgi:hypothetical protein